MNRLTTEEQAANTELYRQNNVELRDKRRAQNLKDIYRYAVVEVRALRNITARYELFVTMVMIVTISKSEKLLLQFPLEEPYSL